MPIAVHAAVREALKIELPGQIGPGKRWEEPFIDSLVTAAVKEACEYCSLVYDEQDITALDGVAEYELDENCIAIYQVEWAVDGSTFDTNLTAVTMEDLDNLSGLWRNDSGTWPTRYTVTSTPGVPVINKSTYSTIIVYPAVSTAGSAILRVRYLSSSYEYADQFSVDQVYVPYVLSMLKAGDDKDHAVAADLYARYLAGLDSLRESASNVYAESIGRLR